MEASGNGGRNMRYLGMAVLSVAVMLALSGAAMGTTVPGPNDYVNAEYTSLGGYYDSSLSTLSGRAYLKGQSGSNFTSLGRMMLIKDGNSGGGPIVNALGVPTLLHNTPPVTTDLPPELIGKTLPVFTAYCLAVNESVATWSSHAYQVKTLAGTGTYSYGLSAQKANDLSLWFNLFEPVVTAHQDSDRAWDPSLGPRPHVNKYGPAFQAGVWEIMNETSGTYNAQTGSFTCMTGLLRDPPSTWAPYMDFNSLTAGWFTQFNAARTMPGAYDNLYPVYAFDPKGTDTSQSFIFMVVPEPVTMAGVMLGIGSVVTYVRKRRMA